MTCVYILQSEVNLRYYIGSTNDLTERLQEHNLGKSKAYTNLTKPYKLVFFQEYESLKEARQIELKLKKLKSRVIIERIIKEGIIKLKV